MSKKTAPPARQRRQRLHNERRERSLAMSIEAIKERELSLHDRDILEADKVRWERLAKKGSQLLEWLEFAPGLQIRRRLAMKLANTNQPKGRAYNEALSQLYAADGINLGDSTTKHIFSAIMWLHDEPERMTILHEIRDKMTDGQRGKLNSPISARQRVEAELRSRESKQSGEPEAKGESQVALLKRKVGELAAENVRLRERHDQGSLFDLKLDSLKDIAAVIVSTVTVGRAEGLARAILEQVKAKKTKQTPAG